MSHTSPAILCDVIGFRCAAPGLLGLRSQMDKTKGWGWADRPPSSISGNDGIREDKVRARISVTGSFTIQGADIM